MGGIDLDPCSNSHENPAVPAKILYTEEEDGLRQHWSGKVYMNPPWGRGIQAWTRKIIYHYESGHVEQAVLALPASTETQWFRPLYNYVVCFAKGRCFFIDGDTGEVPEKGGPTPVAYVYMGPNIREFKAVFGQFGSVLWKV